jgi:signal peptidase I
MEKSTNPVGGGYDDMMQENDCQETETKEDRKISNGKKQENEVLRVVKIIGKVIVYTVLALLVFIVGVLLVDKYIKKARIPSFFGYSSLVISTGSMSGTIEEGDLIIIKNTGDYQFGEIITFFPEGDTIPTTHRIVGVNEDGSFVTRGDANDSDDLAVVTKDQIVGEWVHTFSSVGIFFEWIQNGGGMIYLIAAFLIVGIAVYLYKTSPSAGKQVASNGDAGAEKEAHPAQTDNIEEVQETDKDVLDEKK